MLKLLLIFCVIFLNVNAQNKIIKYKWGYSNSNSFISYNDNTNKWYELSNNVVKFEFSLVKTTNNEIILFASDRKFYLKISNDITYLGYSIDKINIESYIGKWLIWNNRSSVNCSIKLNSLTNNAVFNHDLILIKGSIQCPEFKNIYINNVDSSGRFLLVNNLNLNNYTNLIDTKWPISTYHEFSLLTLLNEGANKINLKYLYLNEKSELNINVFLNKTNKLTEPLHLAIFLNKDSPQVFDMSPIDKQKESNNLTSAIKRFQTSAKLWQAFTSENLNRYNLGYKSFLFEEDSNKQVVINLIRSNYTLNEFWKNKDNDIYEIIKKSIKSNPLYKKKSRVRPLHVACLILDTHWDKSLNEIRGHTALGGGDGDINLGTFGSHLTHSWPENLKQIVNRFTDRAPIDTNFVANDASPYKFKAFDVGIGAFLHEVGHLLSLGHEGGIMHRGFDELNRAFLTIEPSGNLNDFIPIKLNTDDQYPIWIKNDSIKFSKHVCFNLVSNKIKYQWSYGNSSAFISYDDKTDNWYEISDNSINYFKLVLVNGNGDVIIYDSGRNFFIKIANDKMYFGNSINEINNFLYNGKWILRPTF